MKPGAHFFKLFLTILIIFSLYSFGTGNKVSRIYRQSTVPPPAEVIWIVGYTTLDSTLTLNSRETGRGHDRRVAEASANQVIQWKIKGSVDRDIEIIEIRPDTNFVNDPNFFSSMPTQSGSFWEATIGNPSIHTEKYYIKWKLRNTANEYVYDPFIQLNPNLD